MSDVFHNPAAYDPFFSDEVTVRGGVPARRQIAVTLKCCVLDGGFADILAEDDAGTDIRLAEIIFPIAAWPFPEPPCIGDIAVRDGYGEYSVMNVRRAEHEWHLQIRQSMAMEAI